MQAQSVAPTKSKWAHSPPMPALFHHRPRADFPATNKTVMTGEGFRYRAILRVKYQRCGELFDWSVASSRSTLGWPERTRSGSKQPHDTCCNTKARVGNRSSVPADALRLGHGKKINGEENDHRKKTCRISAGKTTGRWLAGLLLPLLLVSLEDYLSPEQ